jgi:hypothetical protein
MPNEIKTKSFRGIVNPETRVLKIINKKGFDKFLESLEGEIEIVVSEVNSRTHWQNNYYWKVVIGTLIGSNSLGGHTKDEMHRVLKNHFKIKSTTKLNVYEFQDYIDRIIRWAAIDFSIVIPEPEEQEES